MLNSYQPVYKDNNGKGFFGYSPRPAPNGMRFNFNKKVWDGF